MGRDEITHPHVNDGELCAGDAAVPIERALSEGRISDAFILIRSVLTNYNSRSPYVRLDAWDGFTCSDCGESMNREESSFCHRCERDLCETCSSYCRSCDETRCGSCLTACSNCGDYCCSSCLEEIATGESLCGNCRSVCSNCPAVVAYSDLDDDGLCPPCAEEADNEETLPAPTLEEAHVS